MTITREQLIADAPARIWADQVMGIWLTEDQPDRKSPLVEYVRAFAQETFNPEADIAKMLQDPAVVHLNMLRGGIAKPSWANIKHLYPEQFAENANSTPTPSTASSDEPFTADDAWHDLVEKDDRTSPEKYPEMCLITQDELRDYMRRSSSSSVLDPSDDIYYEGYEQARSDLSAAPTPSQGSSEVPLQTPQYIIEGIILRRLHEKRIEGYTLEMSKEIAAAVAAPTPTPSDAMTGEPFDVMATIDPGYAGSFERTIDSVPSCGVENDYRRATPPSAAPDQGVRETIAEALWREEAADIAGFRKVRDPTLFADQSETTRAKWFKFADAALAALSRPAPDAAGSEWKDISTAPEFETVHIFIPTKHDGQQWLARFDGDENYWQDQDGEIVCKTGQPTHWRPLPAPPVPRNDRSTPEAK